MVPVTQLEVNDAVLKVKGMEYKLAWELAMDEKYGGDISCCIKRFKLYWAWRTVLSCQVVGVNAIGRIAVTDTSTANSLTTLQITVGEEIKPISEAITFGTYTLTQWLAAIAASVNSYQTVYKATSDATKIYITGNCKNAYYGNTLSYENVGEPVTATITDFAGGICKEGCLSDDTLCSLIGKINSACQ